MSGVRFKFRKVGREVQTLPTQLEISSLHPLARACTQTETPQHVADSLRASDPLLSLSQLVSSEQKHSRIEHREGTTEQPFNNRSRALLIRVIRLHCEFDVCRQPTKSTMKTRS